MKLDATKEAISHPAPAVEAVVAAVAVGGEEELIRVFPPAGEGEKNGRRQPGLYSWPSWSWPSPT